MYRDLFRKAQHVLHCALRLVSIQLESFSKLEQIDITRRLYIQRISHEYFFFHILSRNESRRKEKRGLLIFGKKRGRKTDSIALTETRNMRLLNILFLGCLSLPLVFCNWSHSHEEEVEGACSNPVSGAKGICYTSRECTARGGHFIDSCTTNLPPKDKHVRTPSINLDKTCCRIPRRISGGHGGNSRRLLGISDDPMA